MHRLSFIGRRLLESVLLLCLISLIVFLLVRVAPGDAGRAMAGAMASEESVQAIREDLGLDDPLLVQYGHYLAGLARADLGLSSRTGVPTATIIWERLPTSLWLLSAGTILSLGVAVPLAAIAAVRRDSWLDRAISAGTFFARGMPTYWVGIMLVMVVALPTGWFPVGGFGGSFVERLRSIVLPAATMAAAVAPILVRSLRSSMISVLDADYVSAARSVGVRGARLVRRHLLRNALPPMVTILAVQLAFMLAGAVLIEVVFSLPGLGQALILGAEARDIQLIQGITLFFAVGVVVIHLVADIVIVLIDPRVRVR